MNVKELIIFIRGDLITKSGDLSREIKGGCGADLMSDVLASIQPDAVLLTGLCNPQVVRTAQMSDVAAIVSIMRPSICGYHALYLSTMPFKSPIVLPDGSVAYIVGM